MPTEMQDKANGTQVKHAEQVERLKEKTFCVYFPEDTTLRSMLRKHEVTIVANINIYFVRYLSIETTRLRNTACRHRILNLHAQRHKTDRLFMWLFSKQQ